MTELATRPEQPQTTRQIRVVEDQSEFSMILDTGKFEHLQRIALLFAKSTIIPEHFRENVGNCFIAIQMAVRLGVDPFMFMQKSYIVHGKPGMEAQLAIALINSSGLFADPLAYEINGDDPDDVFDESYRVRAWAVRKSTKERVNGPWVDWKMVRAEGWFDKAGSKWKTMPAIMFCYRAASFFGRLACPERLMGMSTIEELQDLNERVAGVVPAVEAATVSRMDSLAAAREASAQSSASTNSPTPTPTPTPTATNRSSSGRPGPKVEAQAEPEKTDEPTELQKMETREEELITAMDFDQVKDFIKTLAPDALAQAKHAGESNLDDKAPEGEWRAVAIAAKYAQLTQPPAPEQSEEDLMKLTASKFVDTAKAKGPKEIEKLLNKVNPAALEAAKAGVGFVGSISGRKPDELAVLLYEVKLAELKARK